MGQSWCNCEDDVWGRVGGILKMMCGAELVEFLRRYVGRVGGIVKTICGAELVDL